MSKAPAGLTPKDLPVMFPELAELLALASEGWIGLVGGMAKGNGLRLYPLVISGQSEAVGSQELYQRLWRSLPSGFGVNGRRVMPLAMKKSGVIRWVTTLAWRTPLSWHLNFENPKA